MKLQRRTEGGEIHPTAHNPRRGDRGCGATTEHIGNM
jgi:hypothetical protein